MCYAPNRSLADTQSQSQSQSRKWSTRKRGNASSRFLTGSYNNNFVVHHLDSKNSITIEALKDPPKKAKRDKASAADEKKGDASASSSSTAAALGLGKSGKKDAASAAKGKAAGGKDTAAASAAASASKPDPPPNVNLMDFGKKALHVGWHPREPCLAVAGLNKLYIYQA